MRSLFIPLHLLVSSNRLVYHVDLSGPTFPEKSPQSTGSGVENAGAPTLAGLFGLGFTTHRCLWQKKRRWEKLQAVLRLLPIEIRVCASSRKSQIGTLQKSLKPSTVAPDTVHVSWFTLSSVILIDPSWTFQGWPQAKRKPSKLQANNKETLHFNLKYWIHAPCFPYKRRNLWSSPAFSISMRVASKSSLSHSMAIVVPALAVKFIKKLALYHIAIAAHCKPKHWRRPGWTKPPPSNNAQPLSNLLLCHSSVEFLKLQHTLPKTHCRNIRNSHIEPTHSMTSGRLVRRGHHARRTWPSISQESRGLWLGPCIVKSWSRNELPCKVSSCII